MRHLRQAVLLLAFSLLVSLVSAGATEAGPYASTQSFTCTKANAFDSQFLPVGDTLVIVGASSIINPAPGPTGGTVTSDYTFTVPRSGRIESGRATCDYTLSPNGDGSSTVEATCTGLVLTGAYTGLTYTQTGIRELSWCSTGPAPTCITTGATPNVETVHITNAGSIWKRSTSYQICTRSEVAIPVR